MARTSASKLATQRAAQAHARAVEALATASYPHGWPRPSGIPPLSAPRPDCGLTPTPALTSRASARRARISLREPARRRSAAITSTHGTRERIKTPDAPTSVRAAAASAPASRYPTTPRRLESFAKDLRARGATPEARAPQASRRPRPARRSTERRRGPVYDAGRRLRRGQDRRLRQPAPKTLQAPRRAKQQSGTHETSAPPSRHTVDLPQQLRGEQGSCSMAAPGPSARRAARSRSFLRAKSLQQKC